MYYTMKLTTARALREFIIPLKKEPTKILYVCCEYKFGSYGPKWDFVRIIHIFRIRKRIILIMLHCCAAVKGNSLT